MYRFIFLVLLGVSLLSGCGEPHQAASLTDGKTTGGYSVVSRFQTPGYANDVVVRGDLAYMAQGEGGLLIVDISNREYPEVVSVTTENVRGYSAKIDILDTVAYIAAGSFGVTVVHVGDPAHPVVTAANTSMKPAKNLHIFGDFLYTAISEQGISLAEISYPTQPDPRGGVTTVGYAQDMTTTSDSLYVLGACGEMGLSMYNMSDFQNGFGQYPMVGWCDTPGYAEYIDIDEERKLAFVACGTSGLTIIDYADTTNVHVVGNLDEGGYAKELMVEEDLVFMTAELRGLQIIDVSDPTAPYLLGEVDTEFALGVDADKNYVYVADEKEGLIVIRRPQ